MAELDLWQRVWQGPITEAQEADPQDGKLPIHSTWGLIQEWDEEYETQQNVVAIINLAPGVQSQQALAVKQHINACPNKQAFIRMAKNWSYAAEFEEAPEAAKYRVWDNFLARMEAEVSDQGGVLPANVPEVTQLADNVWQFTGIWRETDVLSFIRLTDASGDETRYVVLTPFPAGPPVRPATFMADLVAADLDSRANLSATASGDTVTVTADVPSNTLQSLLMARV